MTAVLDAIWRESITAVRAIPAPVSYVDFARTIVLPDGSSQGRTYNPDSHPAQLAILQAMDGGTYFAPKPFREIAVAKPVQDGGSLVTLIPLLRRVICQRQTVLLAFPSLDSAKDIWTTKVLPILASYGGQEPEGGGGSKGGAARVVTLPDGGRFLLRAAGGRGESQQASVTGDALCIDEADDWPDLHRIELIGKRLEEAPDPLLMLVCTVKKPTGSLIISAVEEGTDSRLHYACPTCGAFQTMSMDSVRYERHDQACVGGSARYVCVACGTAHLESAWREMLRRWLVVHRGQTVDGVGDAARVVGPIPETPRFGIRWSRLESPRKSLHTLCASHARATWYLNDRFDHGPMRSFVQDYMTRGYTDDIDGGRTDLVEGKLIESSNMAGYNRGEIPSECDLVTVGVDIQLRRHYWLAVAFDADDSWYVIDWGRDAIAGDMEQPKPEQRIDGLERIDTLMRTGWRSSKGVLIPFAACDTGFRPDELRPWIAEHRQRWMAAKGAGEELVSRMVKPPHGTRVAFEEGVYDLRKQTDSPDGVQLFVSADDVLDRVASDWQSARGHLPRDIDSELVRHLTGMKPGTKKRWEPRGGRHDYLDCLVYGIGLARCKRGTPPPPNRRYGAIKQIGA